MKGVIESEKKNSSFFVYCYFDNDYYVLMERGSA